jgi:hypothetical protein
MKDTTMTEEIKQNPYAGTPLARRMDHTLGLFDRLMRAHLVTLPPATQSTVLSVSGCLATYSNFEFAGKAARYVPAIGVVLNKIDEVLSTKISVESFNTYLALRIARGGIAGMKQCDVQGGA